MYFICGVGSKAVWLLGASALEDGGGPGGSEVRGGDGRGGRWGGVVMAGEKVGWGGGGGGGGERGHGFQDSFSQFVCLTKANFQYCSKAL